MRTNWCEEAIKENFEIPLRQTVVEVLVDEGWRTQDCEDNKIISYKLNILRKKYKKTKRDSVGVIQAQVQQSKLNLFQEKTTAQEMWLSLQKEFDIIWGSEIGV